MGLEVVINPHLSPSFSQLDLDLAQDSISAPFSSRRLPLSSDFLDPRSTLCTPGPALKSDFIVARSRGLTVRAHGSSFYNSFSSDWSRNLPHGEHNQSNERVAVDGSFENGLWTNGIGLSPSRRGALNRIRRFCGSPSPSGNDSSASQTGHSEGESFVRRDLSAFADVRMGGWHTREDSLGASRGKLSSFGGATTIGVGMPFSLKMLKRRHSRGKLATGLAEVGSSLQEAFSSMVFMMKILQTHTLDMRRQLLFEEVEGLLDVIQREMHSSFLWLFQQIFSCTPELMILIMILLANFTVFSVGNNLVFPPPSASPAMVSFLTKIGDLPGDFVTDMPVNKSGDSFRVYLEKTFLSAPACNGGADLHVDGGRAGDGGGRSYAVACSEDGDSQPEGGIETSAMYSHEDIIPPELISMAASLAYEGSGNAQSEHSSSTHGLFVSSNTELDDSAQFQSGLKKTGHLDNVVLDEETRHNIVAPVSIRLEDDDYSCYDRTDLAYQQAISDDKVNPLLLANYAQFLFLVRHDYDRAEELFRRAVIVDPCNSDALGCFASFLWLARHNLVAAEKAFRAAISADPSSPFHSANYAHFLWKLGQ